MADKKDTPGSHHKASGIRIGVMNNVMVAVAVIVSALLLVATYQSLDGYNSLEQATERYIACQQDAADFREGSDYLTNESRLFAITGDPEHVQNFVEEIETTRRREKAIEDIGNHIQGETYDLLRQALGYSDALIEVESYAMRLLADGFACDPQALPARIRDVALQPEDAALTADQKREAGVEMLYEEDYQEQKTRIYANVEQSIRALVEDMRTRQIASSDHLHTLLRRQRILIVLLLVLLFAVVFFTYVLIIKPLQRGVSRIRDHSTLPVSGSYEMRFLAQTYNDMYDQQSRSTEQLEYSATHDSLTGVYNRGAYDTLFSQFDPREIAVLIIDIDFFKQFNDTYGHDVGDKVLQRVAQVLKESFRSEDYIFRIGGDEFCVVMVHANSQMSGLVHGKIKRANEKLQNPTDGLPKVSLSVGVAFGDREKPQEDIFKDADTALYSVKRGCRGDCAVFGE